MLIGACFSPTRIPPDPLTATGVVIAADGPDAADVDRITLRTNEGRVIELRVGTLDVSNGGLAAPHLREHMLTGDPITAYFYGDELVRYTDAE